MPVPYTSCNIVKSIITIGSNVDYELVVKVFNLPGRDPL